MLTSISLLILLYIPSDNTMRETTVVIRLLVSGVIYLITNSMLLFVIGALNCIPAYFYTVFRNINVEKFFILSFVFYYLLFLFTLLYAVMIVIGTILGFFSQVRIRKIGVTILIITNLIILPFIVINCVLIYFAFKLDDNSQILTFPAYFSIAVSVCQCILFVYSICHIIVICKSFRNRIGNRPSGEYQGTEMVGAI